MTPVTQMFIFSGRTISIFLFTVFNAQKIIIIFGKLKKLKRNLRVLNADNCFHDRIIRYNIAL